MLYFFEPHGDAGVPFYGCHVIDRLFIKGLPEEECVMEQNKNTFERIYDVVRRIPCGKVATYGQVAALAGNKRWARVVGYALHGNPDPEGIPCYRVVTKDGRVSRAFAFGGENRQIDLLIADGVAFRDGHVIMEEYQWDTPWIDDGM